MEEVCCGTLGKDWQSFRASFFQAPVLGLKLSTLEPRNTDLQTDST